MNKTAPWHRALASRHRPVRPDRRRLAVYRGRVVSVADRVTSTTVSGQHGYTSVNSVPEVWIADAQGQELRFSDVTLEDCRVGHEVVIVGDPAKDKILSMRNLSTRPTWFSPSLTDLPFNGGHLFSMIPTTILFCGIASFISFAMFGDAHPFSQLLDTPPPHSFIIECRAPLGMPADDLDGIKAANPGSEHGIGPSLDWLQQQARVAIQRGGQALTGFRLYSLNQRVSDVGKAQLITADEWQACEAGDDELPPREGDCVVGLDLGLSRSMAAIALYWPETGRLEVQGAFPHKPSLADRGEADGVKDRYVRMHERGELVTTGESTVQAGPWLRQAWADLVQDAHVVAICCDRYRQAELLDALAAAGIRAPVIFRGQGFRDGGQDVEGFRKAVFDGQVITAPSLLMRSAAADALVVVDDAMNAKLTKARSLGRIDAVSAAILAVAQGQRMKAAPSRKARIAWA